MDGGNVKGLPELTRYFNAIPPAVQQTALRKGPAAGAKFLREQVRAAAPLGKQAHKRGSGLVIPPGTLKRSVIVVFRREDSTAGQAVYAVTIRQGKGAQAKIGKLGTLTANHDAYYAAWVERGHKIVARYKGNYTSFSLRGRGRLTGLSHRRLASSGSVPAHPFFEPTVRANVGAVLELMVSTMQTEARIIVDKTP